MRKILHTFFILLFALYAAVATASPAYAKTLKVVSSFSIIGDFAMQVGGNKIQHTSLVGPGADSHVYEPSPKDMVALANADLVFINGLGLEGWLAKAAEKAHMQGRIITVSDGVRVAKAVHADKDVRDPHAWQSVPNAEIYVGNIRDALIAADSENAAYFRSSAEGYIQQLKQLDKWINVEIGKVPLDKRQIITTHDAFGYFGREYGVKLHSVIGLSTESEPSAADMARLVDIIRKGTVKAVFLENMTDSRLMKQISGETGAYIGGTLYSDALSARGGPAESYIAMMRHNAEELVMGMLHN